MLFPIDLNVPMDEHWEERRRWIDAIELADKGNALPLIVMLAASCRCRPARIASSSICSTAIQG